MFSFVIEYGSLFSFDFKAICLRKITPPPSPVLNNMLYMNFYWFYSNANLIHLLSSFSQ